MLLLMLFCSRCVVVSCLTDWWLLSLSRSFPFWCFYSLRFWPVYFLPQSNSCIWCYFLYWEFMHGLVVCFCVGRVSGGGWNVWKHCILFAYIAWMSVVYLVFLGEEGRTHKTEKEMFKKQIMRTSSSSSSSGWLQDSKFIKKRSRESKRKQKNVYYWNI